MIHKRLVNHKQAVQVVRCFEDENVVHVSGKVDPLDDTDTINFELVLADVGQVEKRLERLKKGRAKSPEEKAKEASEKAALEAIAAALEDGKPARSADLTEDEAESVKHLQLLTMKPLMYAANVAEDELGEPDSNVHVQVWYKLPHKMNVSKKNCLVKNPPIFAVLSYMTVALFWNTC